MHIPSRELPKIPASTIMELRTEAALEEQSDEGLTSYSYYRASEWVSEMADEMRRNEFWYNDELDAFDTGVKIARALGHTFGERPTEDTFEYDACKMSIEALQRAISNPLLFRNHTEDRLNRLAKSASDTRNIAGPNAQTTLGAFEAVAVPYVDGDEELLRIAKCGAATLHGIIYAIDWRRFRSTEEQSATSAAHLSLVR